MVIMVIIVRRNERTSSINVVYYDSRNICKDVEERRSLLGHEFNEIPFCFYFPVNGNGCLTYISFLCMDECENLDLNIACFISVGFWY